MEQDKIKLVLEYFAKQSNEHQKSSSTIPKPVQQKQQGKPSQRVQDKVRLAKSKFQKSGILEKKSGVYQEKNSFKSGEKSVGFLLDIQELLYNS